MTFEDRIKIIDTLLSIVQRLTLIIGVVVGLVLFYSRLEHKPIADFSVHLVGVDDCFAKVELDAKNIGRRPFTVTDAIVAVEPGQSKFLSSDSSLPQLVAAGETVEIVFDIPISKEMNNRIIDAKFSLKLMEDNANTWRILDKAVKMSSFDGQC